MLFIYVFVYHLYKKSRANDIIFPLVDDFYPERSLSPVIVIVIINIIIITISLVNAFATVIIFGKTVS